MSSLPRFILLLVDGSCPVLEGVDYTQLVLKRLVEVDGQVLVGVGRFPVHRGVLTAAADILHREAPIPQ